MNGKSKPLGEIADYFWRVEFQKRGSPHIHGLLWIKNGPDVLQLSSSRVGCVKLEEFVDTHIHATSTDEKDLNECLCKTCHVAKHIDILSLRAPEESLSLQEAQCDLARVVNRVQRHRCFVGSFCRRKLGECRFGFPKARRESTEIEVTMTGGYEGMVKVHCKRNNDDVNKYSSHLLRIWRANMDIALVGNAYGAAEYTAAYVSKAEPDSSRFHTAIVKAVAKCDTKLPYYQCLKKVANASLSIREISAQEAYYILFRDLPMFGKSRNVVRVKSLRHDRRYYRIETIEDLQSPRHHVKDVKSVDTIRIDALERAYMGRPLTKHFSELTYREFLERYEIDKSPQRATQRLQRWKLSNCAWSIKERLKLQVVVPRPKWKVDDKDANFCFSEILFDTSWRNLSDLPVSDEECLAQFTEKRESTNANKFGERVNSKINRQKKLDSYKNAKEISSAKSPSKHVRLETCTSEQEDDLQWQQSGIENMIQPTRDKSDDMVDLFQKESRYTLDDYERARRFVQDEIRPHVIQKKQSLILNLHQDCDVPNHNSYVYPIGFGGGEMDEDQWIPFGICMHQARHRYKARNSDTMCIPMRMVLHGEGGSGKSWLIRHIVKDVHEVFGDTHTSIRKSKRVLLMAHHGSAAFHIKGCTICSGLGFSSCGRGNFQQKYESRQKHQNGRAKLLQLQERFKDVHLIIIDEFSVVSCGLLYWIDQRLREIWPENDLPFGGRDIVFVGDGGQLKPVQGMALSSSIDNISNPAEECGRRLWESIEHVCLLENQNRGKGAGVACSVKTTTEYEVHGRRCSAFQHSCTRSWKHATLD